MSAHVLLNILNKLGKRDKMQGLPSDSNPVNISKRATIEWRFAGGPLVGKN